MCTVSFVPLQEGFVLTSNRDEKIYRPTVVPKVYSENEIKFLCPIDEQAGGTWIVAKENGTCIVLLNGAFVKHQKKSYIKSRGIILMEIVKARFPLHYFQKMTLKDIEPFTLIIFQTNTLTEVKWDGAEKHIIPKSINKPHFWSSATLYDRNQHDIRKQWFQDLCYTRTTLTVDKILSFHSNSHEENTEYGLVINREDLTKTLSITQMVIKNNKIEMTYIDRIKNEVIENLAF